MRKMLMAIMSLALLTMGAPAARHARADFAWPAGVTPIIPTHLVIPTIGVDAPVEQIGLANDGAVGVPRRWMDVGWYKLGYQPGMFGDATIVGHLDSTTGPAVFWHLGDMKPGDTLSVDDGTTALTFVVQAVKTFPDSDAQLPEIVGDSDVPRLNFITCAGDWNPYTHRYSDRTIVYSALKGFERSTGFASQYFADTGGYEVKDDDQAMFLWEFFRLGGIPALGYPVSQRFTLDGFTVQAFQKAVLQWHPDTGSATFVNVLDRLHDGGKDGWLAVERMTPPPSSTDGDRGLTWQAVVARHEALLNTNQALKDAYLAVDYPVDRFGLPVSPVVDEGAAYVIRCQRAVLQQWKTAVPWADAGQVTVANGGDLLKEAGMIPSAATAPQPPLFSQ